MRRQRGFWNAALSLVGTLLVIVSTADLLWRLLRWHFAPASEKLDERRAARRRRIILAEVWVIAAIGICVLLFSKLGPIRPMHEWRQ